MRLIGAPWTVTNSNFTLHKSTGAHPRSLQQGMQVLHRQSPSPKHNQIGHATPYHCVKGDIKSVSLLLCPVLDLIQVVLRREV